MKKLALIAVVAGFAFASCKKDRTCTCKDNEGNSVVYKYNSTKKDGKDACDAQESSFQAAGGTDITCNLDD